MVFLATTPSPAHRAPERIAERRTDIGIDSTPPPPSVFSSSDTSSSGLALGVTTPHRAGGLYPHYCPICMMHFSRVLESECCHHNLCEICALELCEGAVANAPIAKYTSRAAKGKPGKDGDLADPLYRAQLLNIIVDDLLLTMSNEEEDEEESTGSIQLGLAVGRNKSSAKRQVQGFRGLCMVHCPFCARQLHCQWRMTQRNYKDSPQAARYPSCACSPSPAVPQPPQQMPVACTLPGSVSADEDEDATPHRESYGISLSMSTHHEGTPKPTNTSSTPLRLTSTQLYGSGSSSPQAAFQVSYSRTGTTAPGTHRRSSSTSRGWSSDRTVGNAGSFAHGDGSEGCYALLRRRQQTEGGPYSHSGDGEQQEGDRSVSRDGPPSSVLSPVRAGDGFDALRRKLRPLETDNIATAQRVTQSLDTALFNKAKRATEDNAEAYQAPSWALIGATDMDHPNHPSNNPTPPNSARSGRERTTRTRSNSNSGVGHASRSQLENTRAYRNPLENPSEGRSTGTAGNSRSGSGARQSRSSTNGSQEQRRERTPPKKRSFCSIS